MGRSVVALAVAVALHAAVLLGARAVRGPAVRATYEIDIVDAPPAPADSTTEARPPRAAARARRIASEHATISERKPPEAATPVEDPKKIPDLAPLAPATAAR